MGRRDDERISKDGKKGMTARRVDRKEKGRRRNKKGMRGYERE